MLSLLVAFYGWRTGEPPWWPAVLLIGGLELVAEIAFAREWFA